MLDLIDQRLQTLRIEHVLFMFQFVVFRKAAHVDSELGADEGVFGQAVRRCT